MIHIADLRKNRSFDRFSGHFTPIRPTNHRRERNGLPTSWYPGNVFGPQRPLATVRPPHAPRRRPPEPARSGRTRTLPRWLLPATDRPIAKNRTDPISTSGSSISVCHRTRRFLRTKSFVPLHSPPLTR